MWRVVRNNLEMMMDELLLCRSKNFSDLTRSCEDSVYATALVIRCKGAERCSAKALQNLHFISRFNVSLVSVACYLRRTGRIRPLCLMCTKKKTAEYNIGDPGGFLSFFCAGCSFKLMDTDRLYEAYRRFIELVSASFKKYGRQQYIGTMQNLMVVVDETIELIHRIPITCVEMKPLL